MANDTIGSKANESGLEYENEQINLPDAGIADNSSIKLKPDGSSSRKICVTDKSKHSLLVFSRSAETVGNSGQEQKQIGQRPDRLHARRLSASRRGGTSDHNPAGTRGAGNKTGYRVSKACPIKTSKSCTNECEVLRSVYASDCPTAYSVLCEDLLKDEDSNTFSEIEEDAQEDLTLSESTALDIDNDDQDAKSDITITSEGKASPSISSEKAAGKSVSSLETNRDRPGHNLCSRNKEASSRNSEEYLISDNRFSQRGHPKSVQSADSSNESPSCMNEAESIKLWDMWDYGTAVVEERINSSDENDGDCLRNTLNSGSVTPSKLHSIIPSDESAAELDICNCTSADDKTYSVTSDSTKRRLSFECLNKPPSESAKTVANNLNSLSNAQHRLEVGHVNGFTEDSFLSTQFLVKDSKALRDVQFGDVQGNAVYPVISSEIKCIVSKNNERTRTPLLDDARVEESLNGVAPSTSNSQVNIEQEVTNLFLKYASRHNKHADGLCQKVKENGSNGKLMPASKKMLKTISDTEDITHSQNSEETTVDDAGRSGLFFNENEASFHENCSKIRDNVQVKVQELSPIKKTPETFGYNSPAISILSFNSIKDIPLSSMPCRRDHNDVYHGDELLNVYPSSSTGSSCSSNKGHKTTTDFMPRFGVIHNTTCNAQTGAVPVDNTPSSVTSVCKHPLGSDNGASSSIHKYNETTQEHEELNESLTIASSERKAGTQSPHEMGHTESPCVKFRSQLFELNTDVVLEEFTGDVAERNASSLQSEHRSDKVMNAPVTPSVRRGLATLSVPQLGSHEYLPFLDKLRKEKAARKEFSRQQNRFNKQQRKLSENAKKITLPMDDDCHGDIESLASTPVCPIGREVPPDWKPGEHSSHPLTKISACYTSNRKLGKQRRSIRKKNRILNKKKSIDSRYSKTNRYSSNFDMNHATQQNLMEPSKSCSVIQPHERPGSTDTDMNREGDILSPQDPPTGSFEFKRRYYEKLSQSKRIYEMAEDSKNDWTPIPKRITSQVRLLKTLDEFYSSPSSDDAEGDAFLGDQPVFDVNHQMSLFNYYTTRLKHLSVLENIPGHESDVHKMPMVRIRKAVQEVPSALDHKRLKSLYEYRSKKTVLTSKTRKWDLYDQGRTRPDDRPDVSMKSRKQTIVKTYSRGVTRPQHSPRILNSRTPVPEISDAPGETEQLAFKEGTTPIDKPLTSHMPTEAMLTKLQHKSYLDILKANIRYPTQDGKPVMYSYNTQTGSNIIRKPRSPVAELHLGNEVPKSTFCEEYVRQRLPSFKEKECSQRARLKVRFADPRNQAGRERMVWEMSDEDTWCSTVNAMLLRANRVMDDSVKNDHRYPKPDSARVVSPVPPKSPTFLKELLKQDTIERKQAKGQTLTENRCKETAHKNEIYETRPCRIPTPVLTECSYAASLTMADQPRSESPPTQAKSALVYTLPIKEGALQTNINEKSAGVLKISIQMSKRAQERAWVTHERLKRQRPLTSDYPLSSEMKTLPKKLAPLRISKPINFQNPDSRSFERIPMRDILSKTLVGLGAPAQLCFQPKPEIEDISANKSTNFLLDQHSETLRYYRIPYMNQRSSSIVPLFSDSNNNAYMNEGMSEKNHPDESLSNTESESSIVHFSQDVLTFVRGDDGLQKVEDKSDVSFSLDVPFENSVYGNKDCKANVPLPICISGINCLSKVAGRQTAGFEEHNLSNNIPPSNNQETFLEALLGYETEKSKLSIRKSAGSSELLCVDETVKGHRTLTMGRDVCTPCETFYLDSWKPSFMENVHEIEQPLEHSEPQARQSECNEKGNESKEEETVQQSGSKCSQDMDAIDMTQYMQELLPIQEQQSVPHAHGQQCQPDEFIKRKGLNRMSHQSHQVTIPFSGIRNLSIHGSSLSLSRKLVQYQANPFLMASRPFRISKKILPSAFGGTWKMSSNFSNNDNEAQSCKALQPKITSVTQRVEQVNSPHMKDSANYVRKHYSSSFTKYYNKQTNKEVMPDVTTRSKQEKPVSEFSLYENVFKDLQEEQLCCLERDDRYFRWEKITVPPTFRKINQLTMANNDQEYVTWTDVFKAASVHSIYSTSSVAQNQQDETAISVERENVSPSLTSPNFLEDASPSIFDSMCDPPNSLFTAGNTKETMSSIAVNSEKANYSDYMIQVSSPMQSPSVHDMGKQILESKKVISDEYESNRARSYVSDDGKAQLNVLQEYTNQRVASAISHTETNTSQISDAFDEDFNESVHCVDLGDAVSNVSSASLPHDALRQNTIVEATHNVLHTLSQTCNLEVIGSCAHSYLRAAQKFTLDIPWPQSQIQSQVKRASKFESLIDRSFLKSLRNIDLLQTIGLDTQKLLNCLQMMTRKQGYLPVFLTKSAKSVNSIQMMPQVVTLNHCAQNCIERRNPSFTGILRALPVFYTQDDKGFLTSLYTVNWIPEGIYSLEKAGTEPVRAADSKDCVHEQAHFGRLLQYSPFASDLAFQSGQAYLIGDEVSTRESALKALVTGHDEARGDVAKYFLLMCGWVPPLLTATTVLPPEERKFEDSSGKSYGSRCVNSFEDIPGCKKDVRDCGMSCLPVIKPHVQYQESEHADIDPTEDKTSLLPKIKSCKQNNLLTVNSMKCPSNSVKVNSAKVCNLPSICQSSRTLWSPLDKPCLMLCLRCGVSIDCHNAQSGEGQGHEELDQLGDWTSMDMDVIHKPPRNKPEITGTECGCERLDNNQSWEVSDQGLACPIPTLTTVKAAVMEKSPRSRRTLRPSPEADLRPKMSPGRKTQSMTAVRSRNMSDNPCSSLEHNKSQPNVGKKIQTVTSNKYVGKLSKLRSDKTTAAAEQCALQEVLPDIGVSQGVFQSKLADDSTISNEKCTVKVAITSQKPLPSMTAQNRPLKQHAQQSKQHAPHFKQQPLQTSLSALQIDKDRSRSVNDKVTGWSWNIGRDGTEDEKDLMETRTWTQPVIPPPFPTNAPTNVVSSKHQQKQLKNFTFSKAHLAQHRRKLSHISNSYVSPYWAKKEVKHGRSKTPASDSGDDRSSISRITTISGMSSCSSESDTDDDTSTEESDSESGSSASGSDFFTRYANKGGPTSVDDIFKRTLPRQRLDFTLNLIKEAKEQEEREQLGYLRGREGATPPPPSDQGDNVKDMQRAVTFAVSEYDMCSDAEEIKELWKLCFPEVDFWDRNRRKKFKKRKILS